jgi:hypothetical protein
MTTRSSSPRIIVVFVRATNGAVHDPHPLTHADQHKFHNLKILLAIFQTDVIYTHLSAI